MTTIIWKESHGTAKSRHKARRAEVVESRRRDAKLERIIARTLNGCGNNVANAIIDAPVKSDYLASGDNICIADVALYSAGYRNPKTPDGIKGKDAVKQWKIEREISARV